MRALLVMVLLGLGGVAAAAPRVMVEAVEPLRVGLLPSGAAFEFAVVARDGFTPRRMFVWRGSSCEARPRGLSPLARRPDVTLGDGRVAAVFAAPRLRISSEHCIELEGRAPIAADDRGAVREALLRLVDLQREPNPPRTAAARRATLARLLGGLATQEVYCTQPEICGQGAVRTVAEVVDAWLEGVGAHSPYADAINATDTALAERARRVLAATQFDRLSATWPERGKGAQVTAALAAARTAAVAEAEALMIDAAADGASTLALARLVEQGQAAVRSQGCAGQAACRPMERTFKAAGRVQRARAAEQAAERAAADAQARLGQALDDWVSGRALTLGRRARTQTPAFTERVNYYVSGDLGLAMPVLGDEATLAAFVGVNFYFAPVDKQTPLSVDGGFCQRFSLTAGLTVGGLKDSANTVSGVIGDQAALLGMGYRLTDYLRLGVGGVLFRQRDPNPTVQTRALRVAPYWALSVDLDVVGTVQGFFEPR